MPTSKPFIFLWGNGNDFAVSTSFAARALKRKPQTLRNWACLDRGPIRPVRVDGCLYWPVSEVLALRNKEAA